MKDQISSGKEPNEEQLSNLIPDESLRSVIDNDPESLCSLIVEAKLPLRQFTFSNKKSKHLTLKDPDSSDQRKLTLLKLGDNLKNIVGEDNTNVLNAPGAVVINIQAKKIPEILRIPDIKAIRENRTLPPPIKQKGDLSFE